MLENREQVTENRGLKKFCACKRAIKFPFSVRCSRLSRGGFSLIELMLTVSFVLLGALLIQGSYMRSIDMFGRYTTSLKSIVWMDEQTAHTRETILSSEGAGLSDSGVLSEGGRVMNWSEEVTSAPYRDLYKVTIKVQWTQGSKPVQIESAQYVHRPDLSKIP